MAFFSGLLMGAVLAETAREIYFLEVVPARARNAEHRQQRESARHLWEQVVAAKVPFAPNARVHVRRGIARQRLGVLLMQELRYDDAIAQFEQVLELPMHHAPAFEAEVRQRLAMCLQATGREAQAATERLESGQLLQNPLLENDVQRIANLQVRAQECERKSQYREQMELLQEALPLEEEAARTRLYPHADEQVWQTLLRMSLAAYHLTDAKNAIIYAERGLQLCGKNWPLRGTLHTTAGLVYCISGDLEKAKEHRAAALALAVEAKNSHRIAEVRAQLAEVQIRRGFFQAAEEELHAALALKTQNDRQALATLSMLHMRRGDWPQALAVYTRIRHEKPCWLPHLEEKMQAALNLDEGRGEANFGDPIRALELAQLAADALRNDSQLAPRALGALARAYALNGDSENALSVRAQTLALLQTQQHDRIAHIVCHGRPGALLYAFATMERRGFSLGKTAGARARSFSFAGLVLPSRPLRGRFGQPRRSAQLVAARYQCAD